MTTDYKNRQVVSQSTYSPFTFSHQPPNMHFIAHKLVELVCSDPETDWPVREHVRAKLRSKIKKLLLKCGYPTDSEPAATQTVLDQAELIAGEVD